MGEPHSADYDHHVQWTMCPYCGALQDGAANMTNTDAPDEGDMAICFECGEWAEFDAHGNRVKLTDPETLAHPQIKQMTEVYWEFRRLHPERWPDG